MNGFGWIRRLFTRKDTETSASNPLPAKDEQKIVERYITAGSEFGEAVSYLYMGECVGFEGLLDKWEKWEKEYAGLGYRTISLDAFIKQCYGQPLPPTRQPRDPDEELVLHAILYRDYFLHKIAPSFDLAKVEPGKPQFGNADIPSTELLAAMLSRHQEER